jgi:hypothetical protein
VITSSEREKKVHLLSHRPVSNLEAAGISNSLTNTTEIDISLLSEVEEEEKEEEEEKRVY